MAQRSSTRWPLWDTHGGRVSTGRNPWEAKCCDGENRGFQPGFHTLTLSKSLNPLGAATSLPVVPVNEKSESAVFQREVPELHRRAWVPRLAQAGARCWSAVIARDRSSW